MLEVLTPNSALSIHNGANGDHRDFNQFGRGRRLVELGVAFLADDAKSIPEKFQACLLDDGSNINVICQA